MKLLLVFTVVIASLVNAEYPSNVPRCKHGDNPCQTKASNEVVQKFHAGLKDVNLLPFEPLHVKSIVLEKVPTSPVNVEIKLSDIEITGLKNMQVKSFEGLRADYSGRNVFEAVIPELNVKGHYIIDGRVIILPITGNGEGNLVFKNTYIKYSYDLKPVEKNGEKHATLDHIKLEMTPEHVFYHFDNLFNGDKTLGDNMNKFINENWKEFYTELSPSITKAISLVVKNLMNTFFEKFPYDDYFL